MFHWLWKTFTALVMLALFRFFFEKIQDGKYKLSLQENIQTAWHVAKEQISAEGKNHLRTFKKIQGDSPLLQHANYRILAGTPPQKKKLLTVGIPSLHHPHGSDIVSTLKSLFQTSSEIEQNYIVVLVHLLNPDPEWLNQTVTNISGLFKPHIEAQKLLVIHGLLNGSSLPGDANDFNRFSSCEAFHSRQKIDYALLMSFASNLSDYFLMVGDNSHCTPRFVSTVYWTLRAWKEIPWAVMLEFSNLNFSGKVFHTSDLSRLSSFFFLFQDTPASLLLSSFRFLLGQKVPISFQPDLFHTRKNANTSENPCSQVEEKEEDDEPENPPAQIRTNMLPKGHHPPEHAYFLNENYFQTEFIIPGSRYTVIFDESHLVSRVQVLTGVGKRGHYRVEHGQVELGFEPVQEKAGCTYWNLLGPLVRGKLDQKVYYENDFVGRVRCVKLLVTNFQDSITRIAQIKIWIKFKEE